MTYQLTGGSCDVNPPVDIVWAQGVADANGTALMTGTSRTLPKADHYTLALGTSPEPSSGGPGPGIEGDFVLGQASRYAGVTRRHQPTSCGQKAPPTHREPLSLPATSARCRKEISTSDD